MSSFSFEVKSFRQGVNATAIFSKGELVSYTEKETTEKDGTLITFTPDKEVFKNMTEEFTYERICKEIKNISYLNKGIHFIIKENEKEIEFYSKNGISDFIKDNVEKPLMKNPIICAASDGIDELEIAFMWTGGTGKDYVFVNGLYCPESGSPVTGAKRTITDFMKRFVGKETSSELIRKGLVYAINCKVSEPSFANQTKTSISNPNLRTLASKAFKEGLEEFNNTAEFNSIVEMIKKFQKAETAADKAREAALNYNKEVNQLKKNKLAFIKKLSDAEELGADSTLFVVEGDSAGSSVAQGRDTKHHGILRLRGKMLNSLKAEEEKIYQNEEIKLLLYALGVDLNNYNPNNLRYGKIAICVDQDK